MEGRIAMGAMSTRTRILYAEVEVVVLAEVERTGTVDLKRASIVRRFTGRGVTRSTLFRWLEGIIASNKAGHLPEAQKVAAKPPLRVSVGEIGGSPTGILEGLRTVIRDVQAIVHQAGYGERGVGNAKLVLHAAEVLRRCLETSAKLMESMHRVDRITRFHEAIIQEIAKEDRELALRVGQRLTRLTDTWGTA
jgi:hypothetical protein